MTKKTCVIIGVVISVLTILAFFGVPILGTDFMGAITVSRMDHLEGGWGFANGAYIGNVILMAVSCILIYNNNVKTVDILYPIAVVLSFISLFVLIYEINTNYILGQWKDQTIIFIVILLVMALVQVVTLICYYSSKTMPRRKIMNIVPLKKVPGGLLLAWGLGAYFALGLMGFVITVAFLVQIVALVVYIVGIRRAFFYRPDSKIKGTALVIAGLSIIVVLPILKFFATFFFDRELSYLFDQCLPFLQCIAWVVSAIGFIRIGRTGRYGYLGKHGVGFLKTAAWINASCFVLLIRAIVWPYSTRIIVVLYLVLFVICFILQWKGWRYLLSSWYGESDPELPVMSVVVPGVSDVQEVGEKGGQEDKV